MDEVQALGRELTLRLSWVQPGVLTMNGSVPRLADKKRALGRVMALPGLTSIIDDVTVIPERILDDGTIREDLRDALLEDELFHHCTLSELQPDGSVLQLGAPAHGLGELLYGVHEGIVSVSGSVTHILLKRLIHVVVWWVPGVRSVVDSVEAPDDDGEGLVVAVRLAHLRDPFLANDKIHVTADGGVVILTGQAATAEESLLAEDDAWAVWDTADVVNRLEVAR